MRSLGPTLPVSLCLAQFGYRADVFSLRFGGELALRTQLFARCLKGGLKRAELLLERLLTLRAALVNVLLQTLHLPLCAVPLGVGPGQRLSVFSALLAELLGEGAAEVRDGVPVVFLILGCRGLFVHELGPGELELGLGLREPLRPRRLRVGSSALGLLAHQPGIAPLCLKLLALPVQGAVVLHRTHPDLVGMRLPEVGRRAFCSGLRLGHKVPLLAHLLVCRAEVSFSLLETPAPRVAHGSTMGLCLLLGALDIAPCALELRVALAQRLGVLRLHPRQFSHVGLAEVRQLALAFPLGTERALLLPVLLVARRLRLALHLHKPLLPDVLSLPLLPLELLALPPCHAVEALDLRVTLRHELCVLGPLALHLHRVRPAHLGSNPQAVRARLGRRLPLARELVLRHLVGAIHLGKPAPPDLVRLHALAVGLVLRLSCMQPCLVDLGVALCQLLSVRPQHLRQFGAVGLPQLPDHLVGLALDLPCHLPLVRKILLHC
mmetsp:Transcript_41137/g.106385  ORF Transcript_41137/g.106385 Transcript_41137/m.106385 type:complete len:493 (+) Transcript_41137:1137-2615(+)